VSPDLTVWVVVEAAGVEGGVGAGGGVVDTTGGGGGGVDGVLGDMLGVLAMVVSYGGGS